MKQSDESDESDESEMQHHQLAIIFLASGFDEEFVVQFYCEQKRKGHDVVLVGNIAGEIFGRSGLRLIIDATITEFIQLNLESACAICIPGDQRCAASLLSDPRVVKVLKMAENRPIRSTKSTANILHNIGVLQPQFV